MARRSVVLDTTLGGVLPVWSAYGRREEQQKTEPGYDRCMLEAPAYGVLLSIPIESGHRRVYGPHLK